MCWPSVTSSQKSSHTVTVEDGEMKKKKTFMHTLPSPDGPALRWGERWISDDDSRGSGNRAMRTLSKACWTSDCAWQNEAERYWPWQGRAWKGKSFLKPESVEGRILRRRSNMSQSPSVTQESQTRFVFLYFFFPLPSLSDEPGAQPPPSHFFFSAFLKRNVGSARATSCDAGMHLIPPVITGEYPHCHRLSWFRSQRFRI